MSIYQGDKGAGKLAPISRIHEMLIDLRKDSLDELIERLKKKLTKSPRDKMVRPEQVKMK